MTDVAAPQPVKRRSWLLIASLALNLLILGMVGGAVFARHRMGGPRDPLNIGRLMGDPGLRGFIRSLPKDREAALRAASEPARKNLRPLREAAQQARAAATMALKAEPFDAAQMELAMAGLIAAETAVRQAGVAVLVNAVSSMTPAERAQFQAWRARHEFMPPPPPNPKDQPSAPPGR